MAFESPGKGLSFPTTGSVTLIQYRVVLLTSGGGLKHTTGVSTGTAGVKPVGVVQEPVTVAGRMANVMLDGVTKVEASTRAVKIGDFLRPTSGAASTASRLGGTVRTSTVANLTYTIGQALTSAAAGTGTRYITMRIKP